MMKKTAIPILVLAVFFLICLQSGCKHHQEEAQGRLTSQSGCKIFIAQSVAAIWPPDEEECLHYRFAANVLHLEQQNAAFNCCPGKITAVIAVNDRVITVREKEQEAGCGCTCLYDLELEIVNLEPGAYRIVIDEPYLGGQPPLDCAIALEEGSRGDCCLDRSGIPWQAAGKAGK